MKTIQHGDLKEWKVWVQNLLSLGDLGLLLVGDIWPKSWVIQRKQPCEIPGEGTPTAQILWELREEEMRPEYQLSSQLQLVETNVKLKEKRNLLKNTWQLTESLGLPDWLSKINSPKFYHRTGLVGMRPLWLLVLDQQWVHGPRRPYGVLHQWQYFYFWLWNFNVPATIPPHPAAVFICNTSF